MTVKLLHHTPLWVASKAIRKCWASEDKSDTDFFMVDHDGANVEEFCMGPKDKELIHRVGNKNKHSSTLEHLTYTFDIDGVSRALLQEKARHRHASISVKSTRYTLKELKEESGFGKEMEQSWTGKKNIDTYNRAKKFLVMQPNEGNLDTYNIFTLNTIRDKLKEGKANDKIKYLLPEAYKTSYVWTVNARALQNFLSLRTDKSALWEIRELAYKIYDELPEEHKYLFKEFVKVC